MIALVGIDNGNANANGRKANAMFSNGQNIPEIIKKPLNEVYRDDVHQKYTAHNNIYNVHDQHRMEYFY